MIQTHTKGKGIMKKIIGLFLVLTLVLSLVPIQTATAATKLNKSKITLNVGDSYKLKLTGSKSEVKWSSSDKTVATVSKGKVEAIAGGSTTIKATVGKKQYKCSVTVKDKKIDVIYKAYIFDGSSVDDYAKTYKEDNPDILDAKVYDDEHIIVTMWESERLAALKLYKDNIDTLIDDFITNEDYEGAFIKIEADDLMQNIKVYVDREKYEESFAGFSLVLVTAIISDVIQSISFIAPDDREFNLTIYDNETGEVINAE